MHLLIVDDDAVFARTLARSLSRLGHSVRAVDAPHAARAAVQAECFDAAILDLRLGEHSGLGLIDPLLASAPSLRVLMLTGYASIATAIDAIKRGAFNYLPKPATARQFLAALESEPANAGAEAAQQTGRTALRRLEWEHIQHMLAANDHNISATARALGLHRRTLQRERAKKPVAE